MKKPQWIMISITCVFLCVILGIFVGRNLIDSYKIVHIPDSSQTDTATVPDTAQDGRIDINTATVEQLALLPGIGQTLAQRILDYRTEHNGFSSEEELLQVSGIGEKKLEQIKQFIKVGNNFENSGS